MLKVAVASNDGITVDEHFGRAEAFLIFEVDDDGIVNFLERRAIVPGSPGAPEPAHKSDAVVSQLSDVQAVLAAQIGPGSQGALQRRGIRSFALGGPIERAVSSYGKRHKLLDATIPGLPPGYSAQRRCGGGEQKGGCKG